MNKHLIILGSARSNGNTRKLVEAIRNLLPADLADLQELNIAYFDYENRNQTDDFLPLCEKMVLYDHLLFATPVYGCAMSAQMKTLFDRLGGLPTIRPELAAQLKGRTLQVIAACSDPSEQEVVYKPFEKTAQFLGMRYEGHVFGWLKNEEIPSEVHGFIQDFVQRRL